MRLLRSLAVAPLLLAALLVAQSPGAPPAKGDGEPGGKTGKIKEKERLAVTPEREAAVMMFVKQHHPELGDLLKHLKPKNVKEYERAVRELFRTSELLAQFKDRDPTRYELELKLWQVKSRLQLLAARLQMGGQESRQAELRAALGERFDLETAIFEHEHKVAAERLEKLAKNISRLKSTREKMLEEQFHFYTKLGMNVEPAKIRHAEKGSLKPGEKSPAAVVPAAAQNTAPQ